MHHHVILCGARYQTQDSMHVREALSQLSYPPAPDRKLFSKQILSISPNSFEFALQWEKVKEETKTGEGMNVCMTGDECRGTSD